MIKYERVAVQENLGSLPERNTYVIRHCTNKNILGELHVPRPTNDDLTSILPTGGKVKLSDAFFTIQFFHTLK